MTSKKQQNSGFLLPNPVTGYDTVCLTLQVPNVREYRAAIVGHLYKLGNWWTWEKSYTPTDERAKQAAAMWRRLLAETLQINECGYEPPGGDPVATGCVPVGWIISTATAATPDGFLPCNGATYLRVDYPELYAAIDNNLKVDADHFKVPNIINGRIPAGVGTYPVVTGGMSGTAIVNVGSELGEYAHTLTTDEMPTHSHQQQYNTNSGMVQDNGFTGGQSAGTTPAGTPYTPLTTANAGGGQPHMNMPPITGLRFFIRATDCNTTGMENFDMRLDGCVLQYTFNGSMWFVVDGWTTFPTCITHPETGQPFDLRINNCLLEYSKDSAQTWNTVPGWADIQACIDTDTPYDLRMQDGLLQWSKDGGQDWATVEGWTTQIGGLVNEPARCLNAWGLTNRFSQLAAMMVFALTFEPTLSDYTDHCATVWYDNFSDLGLPDELQQFVVQSFNVALRAEYIAKFENELKQETLARYFYTASPDGAWCDENVQTFLSWMLCGPGITEDYITSIILLFQALLIAYENANGNRDEFRAFLYQWRDFGTCHDCSTLLPVETCSEPQDWICNQPMTSGMGQWSVSQLSGGSQTNDTYGLMLDADASAYHVLEIERAINGTGVSMTVECKAQAINGHSDIRIIFLARVGGNWNVITYWQKYSDGTFLESASIPANAEAIRIRLYSTSEYYPDMWIGSAAAIINTVIDPC